MDAIRQIGREFESKKLVAKQRPPAEIVDLHTLEERNRLICVNGKWKVAVNLHLYLS